MTLNITKLGREATSTKYLAGVVCLIFPLEFLIWNEITFPVTNSPNLAELVVNELMRTISKKIYQHSFFYLLYHCLM